MEMLVKPLGLSTEVKKICVLQDWLYPPEISNTRSDLKIA